MTSEKAREFQAKNRRSNNFLICQNLKPSVLVAVLEGHPSSTSTAQLTRNLTLSSRRTCLPPRKSVRTRPSVMQLMSASVRCKSSRAKVIQQLPISSCPSTSMTTFLIATESTRSLLRLFISALAGTKMPPLSVSITVDSTQMSSRM